MKVVAVALAATLAASPALARASDHPIIEAAEKAARDAAAAQESHASRRKLFWPGLGLGIAGVTIGVLAVTTARVEDKSSGNAPAGTYQACVAQKTDPIYATNDCGSLKAKNAPLLAAGVAIGAAGAALMIAGSRTTASVGPGVVRVMHQIRF